MKLSHPRPRTTLSSLSVGRLLLVQALFLLRTVTTALVSLLFEFWPSSWRNNNISTTTTTTLTSMTFLFLSYFCCDAAASAAALLNLPTKEPSTKTYNYFAYGSNMSSSTMTDLRHLRPVTSTAAILPGYQLRFNVPGLPGVEPSWASVEPVASTSVPPFHDVISNDERWQQSSMELVHGVLHTLTAMDFATLCRTEGVPFAYALEKCRVIPYTGDGKVAGKCEWEKLMTSSGTTTTTTTPPPTTTTTTIPLNKSNNWGVSAYTLIAGPMTSLRRRQEDIPPSRSYVNVLLRGAKEFALDESYRQKLELIPVGRTWIGNGLAEGMLQRAAMERRR